MIAQLLRIKYNRFDTSSYEYNTGYLLSLSDTYLIFKNLAEGELANSSGLLQLSVAISKDSSVQDISSVAYGEFELWDKFSDGHEGTVMNHFKFPKSTLWLSLNEKRAELRDFSDGQTVLATANIIEDNDDYILFRFNIDMTFDSDIEPDDINGVFVSLRIENLSALIGSSGSSVSEISDSIKDLKIKPINKDKSQYFD